MLFFWRGKSEIFVPSSKTFFSVASLHAKEKKRLKFFERGVAMTIPKQKNYRALWQVLIQSYSMNNESMQGGVLPYHPTNCRVIQPVGRGKKK